MTPFDQKDQANDRRALLAQALRSVEEMKARVRAAESAAHEPIAIVGAGCRFPGGVVDLDSYWQLLIEGRDAVVDIPRSRWQAEPPATPTPWYAGLLTEPLDRFDPTFFRMSAREASTLDPQHRLVLEVGWEALESAGQAPDRLTGSRTGVFVGITTHDYADMIRDHSGSEPDLYTATGNAHNAAAGRLSYFLGLQGPSVAIDTACSSSLVAIHWACQSLRWKECAMALAGGVNALLTPDPFVSFSKWGMMAPDGRCKTFDASANGFVRSEGCGLVVLKRLRDAIAAGDRVLAVIRGSAVNQDGRSSGLTVPNGPAQEAVIRLALADARAETQDISYVEAHGTGTSLGDPIEAHALGAVYGTGRTRDNPLWLGSVKTNIGHLESAAGVAGLLKLVVSLQHGCLPPHLHFHQWNPDIDWKGAPVEIPREAHPWPHGSRKRVAGISGFGFSGTNAHLIVEEAPAPALRREDPDRPLHLLALSAHTGAALANMVSRYTERLQKSDEPLADICFTANTGRAHFERRIALVASSTVDMLAALKASDTAGLGKSGSARVVFLFTGQGAQYPGMGRELYETQPVFRAAMEECNRVLQPLLEQPLLEVLYGSAGRLLDQTAYTQPALFAVEYALAELWKSWGIRPTAVMGHSVGEYAALCVAGVVSLEEGLGLIAERARRMQELPGQGAMAAVLEEEEVVREAMRGWQGQVSIAAVNGPKSVVISGERAAVEAVMGRLRERGVGVQELTVSHAFHSAQMEPMVEEFARRAAGMEYRAGRVTVISSVTGQAVGVEELKEAGYWRRQVRETVQFRRGMETLGEAGHRTYVEIGPGTTLLGLGRRCVEGLGGEWLASLRRGQGDWQLMLESLGALYVRGAEVDWAGFDKPYDRRRVPLPTYPFERQRYWLDAPAARRIEAGGHPLLGKRMDLAGSPASSVWQTEISIERLPYLADHCIQDSIVVPATAYVEMATAAALDFFGDRPVRLSELDFQKPLVLSAGSVHSVQVCFTSIGAKDASIQIHSRPAASSGGWTQHVVAKVGYAGAQPAASLNRSAFEDFVREAPTQIAGNDFYDHFSAQGNQWGPTFRGVTAAWVGSREAWTRVEIPSSLEIEIGAYRAHPAVADACGHVLGAIDAFGSGEAEQRGSFVAEGIDSVTTWRPLRGTYLLCHARMWPGSKPNVFLGDVQVFDPSGNIVSHLEGARLRFLESGGAAPRPENWCYQISWRHASPKGALPSERSHWIILTDRTGVGDALAQRMNSAGMSSIRVRSEGADAFRELEQNLANPMHATGLICLWGLDISVSENTPGDDALQEIVRSGGVPAMLGALASARMPGTRVWLVTRGAQACEGIDRSVAFWQAPLWGLGRAFAVERADLWGGLIDLDPQFDAEESADALWRELRTAGNEDQLALRGDLTLAARLEPQNVHPAGPPPFRSDGAYLITGGLGGIGLEIAQWMADAGAGHIVLMSRTRLPQRVAWGRVQPGDPMARTIDTIRAIEQKGSFVHAAAVDVSDEAAVRAFVDGWERESRPPIRGVVHAAGTLVRSSIATMSSRDLETVLRPKLGGWFLHRALERMPLEFFVLFSSASSVLSFTANLAAYAAANSLLDGLGAYRNHSGKPGLSINWGLWTEAGMVATFGPSEVQELSDRGMGGLSNAAGLQVLSSLIRGAGQTAVLPMDWRKWASRYPAYMRSPLLSSLLELTSAQSASIPQHSVRQQIVGSGGPSDKPNLLAYLAEALGKILGFPASGIDPSIHLTQLGLDSLTGIEFKNRIDADLGVSLPMVRFLEGPPLDTLAVELLEALERENIAATQKPTATYSDAALLANLDHLTEAEIDAALADLMRTGQW